jgi:hypothetical protein
MCGQARTYLPTGSLGLCFLVASLFLTELFDLIVGRPEAFGAPLGTGEVVPLEATPAEDMVWELVYVAQGSQIRGRWDVEIANDMRRIRKAQRSRRTVNYCRLNPKPKKWGCNRALRQVAGRS